MNSHCIQIIQMVKKNTFQIYPNSSLPNSKGVFLAKMVHSLSKLSNYFNIVLIPTTRWIQMYYFKLHLILYIHKVIKLIIRLIHF